MDFATFALAHAVATLAGHPWDAEVRALGVASLAAKPATTRRILARSARYTDENEPDAGPNTVLLALTSWTLGLAVAHSLMADARWLTVATTQPTHCGPVTCALYTLLATAAVAIALLDAALESPPIERATHWSVAVGIARIRGAAATILGEGVTEAVPAIPTC